YKASKFLAEQVALGFAHQGLPVVVVNPSAPGGPWEVKPTPTGRMVVDFLEGKMVATLDTGLNLVHVRDVARGHLLAGERGKIGEKYILGNRNISLAEIGALLSEIAGIRPPRVRIPYWVAWSAALSMEAVARVTGAPPRVPLTAVRMAKKRMYFSPARAVRELGGERAADPSARRRELQRWREDVARCYEPGATPTHPIAMRLQAAVRAYTIPRPALEAIIEGVEMDLDRVAYETADDLYPYCYRAASAVA